MTYLKAKLFDQDKGTNVDLPNIDKDVLIGFVSTAGDYVKIPAKIQRKLFGTFLGKGTIEIHLAEKQPEIRHYVKLRFGGDSFCNKYITLGPEITESTEQSVINELHARITKYLRLMQTDPVNINWYHIEIEKVLKEYNRHISDKTWN